MVQQCSEIHVGVIGLFLESLCCSGRGTAITNRSVIQTILAINNIKKVEDPRNSRLYSVVSIRPTKLNEFKKDSHLRRSHCRDPDSFEI